MRTASLFVLISVIFYACGSDPAPDFSEFDEGPVVSIINTDTLSSAFFEKAYIEFLINSGANDNRENRYNLLNKLTDDLLLAQTADNYGLLDSVYLDYRKQVERASVADRFFTSSFLDTLSLPTEEQIQAAFFSTKIKMHVSHLFFTKKEEAEAAYNRLQNGEKFVDLANEIYHITPYDSSAGYLGEISYFNVDDAFGEAAYQLKAGEYSSPVRTRQGYHIIFVDNRIANPIMTKSEFEYKKRGITGLTKNRIKNLKGDAFVQSYMQSLNVKVDQAAVEQLFFVLKSLQPKKNNAPLDLDREITTYPSTSDIRFLRNELESETILASYKHLGEQKYFKAEDYFTWLKTLPLEEARNKTMASVGRALRNQVFYEAGRNSGIENDPIVQYNLEYKTAFYKAYLVKQFLSEQPVPEITKEEQEAAFYGLGMNAVSRRIFSGWVIECDSFEQAQVVKQKIESAEKLPNTFGGYSFFQDEDLRKMPDIATHIWKAPLNASVVAGTNKGFYVLNISDRNEKRTTFDEAQDKVLDRISKYYNIVDELKKLRKSSSIKVDTVTFESLMTHFDDPSLRGYPAN